jgi:hypothetical protein
MHHQWQEGRALPVLQALETQGLEMQRKLLSVLLQHDLM